jgi:hypothetical protein
MRSQNLAASLAQGKDSFTSVVDTGEELFSSVIDTREAR